MKKTNLILGAFLIALQTVSAQGAAVQLQESASALRANLGQRATSFLQSARSIKTPSLQDISEMKRFLNIGKHKACLMRGEGCSARERRALIAIDAFVVAAAAIAAPRLWKIASKRKTSTPPMSEGGERAQWDQDRSSLREKLLIKPFWRKGFVLYLGDRRLNPDYVTKILYNHKVVNLSNILDRYTAGSRWLKNLQRFDIDGYSPYSAVIVSDKTLEEKRGFIEELQEKGILPTQRDYEMSHLELWERTHTWEKVQQRAALAFAHEQTQPSAGAGAESEVARLGVMPQDMLKIIAGQIVQEEPLLSEDLLTRD